MRGGGLPRKQIYDLAGESQRNADGSSRQTILRECVPGEGVYLVRELTNQSDPNAILVVLEQNGLGLGYFSREDAATIAPVIDGGVKLKARIHELTGGLDAAPFFGCRVCVVGETKAFRSFKALEPQQRFYAHAPTWRAPPQVKPAPKLKRRSKGLFAMLLSRLFR